MIEFIIVVIIGILLWWKRPKEYDYKEKIETKDKS
jgi:hypothetical protein